MQRNLALRWLRKTFPRNSSQPGVVCRGPRQHLAWSSSRRCGPQIHTQARESGNLAKREEACVGLPDRPSPLQPWLQGTV